MPNSKLNSVAYQTYIKLHLNQDQILYKFLKRRLGIPNVLKNVLKCKHGLAYWSKYNKHVLKTCLSAGKNFSAY